MKGNVFESKGSRARMRAVKWSDLSLCVCECAYTHRHLLRDGEGEKNKQEVH